MSCGDHHQIGRHGSTQQACGLPALGGFATGNRQVVHELRNLLDGALRNLGLAQLDLRSSPRYRPEEPADTHKWAGRLKAIQSAMERMALLIRHTTDQNPLGSGLVQQELGEAIEQAVCLLEPMAARHGIVIRASLTAPAAQLPAGPIYSVVDNAVRNSIQAMVGVGCHPPVAKPNKRVISLSVGISNGWVELRVCDTGPGIDPVILDRDGRVRWGQSTQVGRGHGVGLPLCREIASGLGGHLTLKPNQPCGAVFLFRYPNNPPNQNTQKPSDDKVQP